VPIFNGILRLALICVFAVMWTDDTEAYSIVQLFAVSLDMRLSAPFEKNR